MRTRFLVASVLGALVLSVTPVRAQTTQENPVAQAREMAFSGERDEALRVLAAYLEDEPDDTDARTLLGTVLSWEGEYDAARAHLRTVLDGNPTHGDALPALVNVELWSDHPQQAASLAGVGLAAEPTSATLLVARARALWNLTRADEALDSVNEALRHDPGNEPALSLRRSLRDLRRLWRADVSYSYDSFDDDRSAWTEARFSVRRQSRVGSVIARFYQADRFGRSDQQIEVDMYPRFRDGTYAYVSGAVSPDAVLFPEWRFGFDLYQSLGAGWEVSGGYRRLQFDADVNIYVGSVTKYKGNWMLTGRVFTTPKVLGTSVSFHGIVRHYGPDGERYIGARYGRGSYREEVRSTSDLLLLDSDTLAGEFVLPIGPLKLQLSASVSREGRAARPDLWQFSTSSGLGVRF
jgi:YaiO family outer membrane protein